MDLQYVNISLDRSDNIADGCRTNISKALTGFPLLWKVRELIWSAKLGNSAGAEGKMMCILQVGNAHIVSAIPYHTIRATVV